MKSLNNSNTKAADAVLARWAQFVLLTTSMIGIADAGYLTYSFFEERTVTCSILDGCNVVLESTYATIGGIPLAAIGLVFYLFVFAAMVGYLSAGLRRRRLILRVLTGVVSVGFLVSLVLVYLQVFVLGALCFYCIISAVLVTLLFAALLLSRK